MIRPAIKEEAKILTKISFESKGYWSYPKEYFDIWKNELSIRPEYIEENVVYVYEEGGEILGYYSIVELRENVQLSGIKIKKGFWLEHMFVVPRNIGQGIGTKLFNHLRKWCQSNEVYELGILADPHSIGFYEKKGCDYQREYPSTIANRTTPLFVFKIKNR
ncbi:MAG: GNAT family N-acetyltransferase [Bacteroidota bacterium]